MRVLLDTNILLRLAVPSHPMFVVARQAVKNLADRGDESVVVPQVIYEYWVVSTRPLEQNGLGLSAQQTGVAVDKILKNLSLLPDNPGIFELWQTLVTTNAVHGKTAHDARMVAAMMRHGVSHLLTFNHADFRRFHAVTAIDPSQL